MIRATHHTHLIRIPMDLPIHLIDLTIVDLLAVDLPNDGNEMVPRRREGMVEEDPLLIATMTIMTAVVGIATMAQGIDLVVTHEIIHPVHVEEDGEGHLHLRGIVDREVDPVVAVIAVEVDRGVLPVAVYLPPQVGEVKVLVEAVVQVAASVPQGLPVAIPIPALPPAVLVEVEVPPAPTVHLRLPHDDDAVPVPPAHHLHHPTKRPKINGPSSYPNSSCVPRNPTYDDTFPTRTWEFKK